MTPKSFRKKRGDDGEAAEVIGQPHNAPMPASSLPGGSSDYQTVPSMVAEGAEPQIGHLHI